jgi:hypothetical protein
VIGSVSGRVLLSLREHLQNRTSPEPLRAFPNRRGRTWVVPDTRPPLAAAVVERLSGVLDAEIARRLPDRGRVLVDPLARSLALPLSQKSKPTGFGVLPRGSVSPVAGGHLRFFIHWKQRERRTDYDLSVLLLDEDFTLDGQVSWTNLRDIGAVHSGDIVEAPDGASEFIDIDLAGVRARYLVPLVHIYAGEGFTEVEEALFGYMEREAEQQGRPFEARTVRMKSGLTGTGRVALPLAFARTGDGGWSAHWLHLYTTGWPNFNAVENSLWSASHLTRSILHRRYLRLSYLLDLMPAGTADGVTYIGLERPDDLPDGADVYTLDRLHELIPE